MRFFLTKRFAGLIAYSALIFWMVFYGDMASKILGTGAACAMMIIMAYRIEDLLKEIDTLEKNIDYGKFGKDGKSAGLGSGKSASIGDGTTRAPDILPFEDCDDGPMLLDNDDEDNLFRRKNLKEVKR